MRTLRDRPHPGTDHPTPWQLHYDTPGATVSTPDPDPITITPADQRRAAELIQAAIVCEPDLIDALLAEAATEGIERALALVGVMTRWTAVSLVDRHGLDGALRCIEGTRLDAAVAEVPEDE